MNKPVFLQQKSNYLFSIVREFINYVFHFCLFLLLGHNARLSGEQRYHDTNLLHRNHKSQCKPKPPSVANPS
ncbi:hypothetical protein CGT73_17800 [Vibrio cholerae]|nr:hypothetical protein CGT83_17750 [Vibrio cholerae]PAR97617.1 hypothetical protein CGT79_17470 [Vibrio cholerae]PAS19606.1 hypothetical protein CGT73_17800 [Vibrio cholerae]